MQKCPLKCDDNDPAEDTHEHILTCTKLSGSNVPLEFMHGSTVEKIFILISFSELMRALGKAGGLPQN